MNKLLYITAILIAVVSCTSQVEQVSTPFVAGQEVTLCATMPSGQAVNHLPSKQRISGKDTHPTDPTQGSISLSWDKGDEVLVTVGGKSAVFTLESGARTNNATFTGTMPTDGNTFHVTYPINYTDDVLSHQTYTANGFGKGLMKMSTKIPGTLDDGFTLSADNALLGLKLQGDANVSKIVLTQKDNDDNAENDKTYTLDCSTQVVNTADGALFYIVVPAGTWSKGFTIEVYNDNDVVIEKREKITEIVFSAGQALMMPEVEVHDILTFEVNGVKINMVYVEGGTFMMGATAGKNEFPQHSVTLSSYMISQTEVTQGLWEQVMGYNNSLFKGEYLPVEKVSWEESQTFIQKLNEMTGKHFRLPTEAEWEYAARGGKNSRGYTYSGSNNIDSVAWYQSNCQEKTHTIANLMPNELGIYDMSGNVWEWCQDYFNSSKRVVRGGSFYDEASTCRITYRTGREEDYRSFIGIRLALDEHEDDN